MQLGESRPIKQNALAEALGMEPCALSRLLTRLELHRYVIRERTGTDKVVNLTRTEQIKRTSMICKEWATIIQDP
jgi:DNA-binding MarR family transcriptional regulator